MKVSSIGRTMVVQPRSSDLQLDWAKQNVVKAKSSGQSSVSFAIQDDNLISKLQNLYGKDNVAVEASSTKKVTVKW